MGIFLAVDGDKQHVGAGHFFSCRTIDMQDGALDHTLETQRRLRVHVAIARHDGRVLLDKFGQRLLQFIDFGRAGLEHLPGRMGSPGNANSKCSTVMNSCRFERASTKACGDWTSSSCAIMVSFFPGRDLYPFKLQNVRSAKQAYIQRRQQRRGSHFFHAAAQRMLVFACVIHNLFDFHRRHIARNTPQNAAPLGVHFEHDLRGAFVAVTENFPARR